MTALIARALTPARWGELERLFGPSGAYSNCWCTFQRQTGAEFGHGCANAGAGNRALLRRLTDEGRRPGLIGYLDGEPVGWVSVGPRPQFGRILRSPIAKVPPEQAADRSVWAVVCFFISRQHRRKGVARSLLEQAVAYAQRRGAAILEGYPVDTRGHRVPSSGLFTGTLDLFLASGFRRAAEHVAGRPVVQMKLTA